MERTPFERAETTSTCGVSERQEQRGKGERYNFGYTIGKFLAHERWTGMAQQLQRQRARKARDNFLKMLAENTEIDHRTTWREATRILADEPRFTAVEDEREREEIYNDFVFELAKKEKQVCFHSRPQSVHA